MKNSPTQLRWRWCRFDELGVHELQNIYTARQLVFVLEQECAYLDADGVDEQSHHLAAWSAQQREPLAYARVVAPDGQPQVALHWHAHHTGHSTAQGTG